MLPFDNPQWQDFGLFVGACAGGLFGLHMIRRLGQRWQASADTPTGLRREAHRAARVQDYLGAAELFERAGDLADALEHYERAGANERAARAARKLGHHRKAASLFERARVWETAADEWREAGDLRHAESCYVRARKRTTAARMYEECDEPKLAIPLYVEAKRLDHAARLAEQVGDLAQAATLLTEMHRQQQHTHSLRSGALASEALDSLVERAAALYEQLEDHEGLLALLRRAGRLERAAELAARLERPDQAIELFLEAGREDRAAVVLEATGQVVRAARIRGDLARRTNQLASAARHYVEAGDMREAGQVYEQLADYESAADAYAMAGDPAQAAYCYARIGAFEQAAVLYDRAGRIDKAVRCYRSTGDLQRAAELLERAGRHFEAGEIYLEIGDIAAAIRCLQRVPNTSPSVPAADALLGIAFFEAGEMRLARTKLEAAVEAGGVGAAGAPSADVHYHLGRLYEASGELDRARDEFERVLGLNFRFRDAPDRLVAVSEALSRDAPDVAPAASPQDSAVASAPLVDGLDTPSAGQTQATDEEDPNAATRSRPESNLGPLIRFAPTAELPMTFDDRYELLGELGRGGMGVVYKCHDKLLDRLVAYKVLGAQIRSFPTALANFMREAKSAARLNHQNIVTLYDFGESRDGHYMTLEYVPGRNLRQYILRSAPDIKAVRGVLIGICNGLQYAHSQSVIHRDIKPSNILISSIDLKAKILDFGLAKVIERSGQSASGVLGTPWYMSPEQVLGTSTDGRTDLYSLGITLFEIFVGRLPFRGRDFGYHHVHTKPPRADSFEERISPAFADLIDRCIQKSPDDRFQTADEIRHALHTIDLYDPSLFDERRARVVKPRAARGEGEAAAEAKVE